jgi:peptidoglycan/xylan/chitin deacetylase (PgdA/CDA1 family)
MFVVTVLVILLAYAAVNVAVDPFGVFGDSVFDWYSYDMTQNPRAAKIAYLDKRHGEYNAYLFGSSGTSALSVDRLNAYTGLRFYNMFSYGTDLLNTRQEIAYILEHYGAESIVLALGVNAAEKYDMPREALKDIAHVNLNANATIFDRAAFYLKFAFADPRNAIAKIQAKRGDTYLAQPFDVFTPETGAYDKRERDVEPFGSIADYYAKYPVFDGFVGWRHELSHIDECEIELREIARLCEQYGAELTIVVTPEYAPYAAGFDADEVAELYGRVAAVSDFWDFAMSSVSLDARYFYDESHFRDAVGDMMLARIFGDTDVYVPDDFGALVTADNARDAAARFREIPEYATPTATVPVLMYHNVAENASGEWTITPEQFESHLAALQNAGFEAVTIDDMTAFTERGVPLPAKPVLITFDDGYAGNYDYAYPLLRQYGMRASIFVIGVSFGHDTYKDTDIPITPHFGDAAAREMVQSGVITLYSHTYDMHQSRELDGEDCRDGVSRFPDEDDWTYADALTADFAREAEILRPYTADVTAFAYPEGKYNILADAILNELGVKATFTTQSGAAMIVAGLPQTLRALPRLIVTSGTTADELMNMIQDYLGDI